MDETIKNIFTNFTPPKQGLQGFLLFLHLEQMGNAVRRFFFGDTVNLKTNSDHSGLQKFSDIPLPEQLNLKTCQNTLTNEQFIFHMNPLLFSLLSSHHLFSK